MQFLLYIHNGVKQNYKILMESSYRESQYFWFPKISIIRGLPEVKFILNCKKASCDAFGPKPIWSPDFRFPTSCPPGQTIPIKLNWLGTVCPEGPINWGPIVGDQMSGDHMCLGPNVSQPENLPCKIYPDFFQAYKNSTQGVKQWQNSVHVVV